MSNPWITRDIGRGPIGLTRTPKTTPGIIDINSCFDGILVARRAARKKTKRKEMREIRATLKQNQSTIDRKWTTSQRCKDTAKATLQGAIDDLNNVLRKKGPIKDKDFDRIRKKAEDAIAEASRLHKYNTPPFREAELRYFLFIDLLEARKRYTWSVDHKVQPDEVRATRQMVTAAVKPYVRAMNLLRRIDAPEPPNGDTIFDGTYPALAWPQSGLYSDEKKEPKVFYKRLSDSLDTKKQEIAQDTGGVWNHEKTLDELMKRNSEWFRALVAGHTAADEQQINKYLKILWGKSAKLTTYGTQFQVDFKKDEVPPPEAIKQPADCK
jgi:hypothetical protein